MQKYILALLFIVFSAPVFAQQDWNSDLNEKEKLESDLKIYPNPSKNNKVTVDFQSKEIAEISLTNITGKQVLRKKYDFPIHKTQLQLNTIPNGIYLIQIKTTDTKMVVKKLMVSKN